MLAAAGFGETTQTPDAVDRTGIRRIDVAAAAQAAARNKSIRALPGSSGRFRSSVQATVRPGGSRESTARSAVLANEQNAAEIRAPSTDVGVL